MNALSETPEATRWLERFSDVDRPTAIALIDEILLVSRDDFSNGLDALLDAAVAEAGGPVALFGERPIKKVYGKIPAFFRNSRRGRAEGAGGQPIIVDPRDQEVGSEGIVANLITDYSRRHENTCFPYPGPTKMRDEKVRAIILVTDFIGSGDRITRMLEAFRYVATIRSWRSYKLIRFVVVAYSGLDAGIAKVRSHRLKPEVRTFTGCPTLKGAFTGNVLRDIERLCRSYPKGHREPLGYKTGGALIAFSHGSPNNAPPILHSRSAKWVPLFKGRSTTGVLAPLLTDAEYSDAHQRVTKLLGIRGARKELSSGAGNRWISTMLVLAAAERGVRQPVKISAKTHLSVGEVTSLRALAIDAGWLDSTTRLTPLGRRELARLRRRRRRAPILAANTEQYYYPTQLRAP
ncbi:hypothetical protein [Longimicrobium terrae]|uniref:Uncharacterized protein n=1 Tax=Longimicrobium terrae TaxID=1639882 RepID=A0A841H1P3_9BACT|nr:hypothetical protein [Longimicrobium terrae]MBB4637516.1 hypothetical protein [Longimicrobium terrae]MBB6071913.1 hypothetical protein [Longimicrobium terrae]NNC30460.1 hypothetical protein [Longimicrobium terrae]